MGALGTDVLAAHQIVLQTVAVIFMIPLGMSLAAMALLLFPQFVDRYLLFKNLISSAETRMTQSL